MTLGSRTSTTEATQSPLAGYDTLLVCLVCILICVGLLEIFASSSTKSFQQFHDTFFFFRRQATAIGTGAVLFALVALTPLRIVSRFTLPLLAASILLLALILIPGFYVRVGGAFRWLKLGFIQFQPVEIAKVGLFLFLAKNLSRDSARISSVGAGVLPNLIVYTLIATLVMLQPDFGSVVVMGAVTMLMLLVAGISRGIIFVTTAASIAGIVAAVVAQPYRMARLVSFLDPWSQVQGSGFQIIQSYLAFQNGGLLGLGLGSGKQKLFFLPEAHTDFILPVVGEELGFLGVALVWAAFLGLAWIGFQTARAQVTNYRRFLAFGATLTITLQALINMGVTMGLLPTKGIPLPFVSSGRSSLLCFILIAGLIYRLIREPSSETA